MKRTLADPLQPARDRGMRHALDEWEKAENLPLKAAANMQTAPIGPSMMSGSKDTCMRLCYPARSSATATHSGSSVLNRKG